MYQVRNNGGIFFTLLLPFPTLCYYMRMIQFEEVSKRYGKSFYALRDVTFHIAEEEFVFITGPSGSGKTTILKLLIAEEKPTKGRVTFYSLNVHNLRRSDIPRYRQKLGVVFQDYRLIPDKTVRENISFVMEMLGAKDSEINENVRNVLNIVRLKGKEKRYPHQLSGGEQQRLAIARAIVNEPDILLVDEPTASLDKENSELVLDILKKIHELGTTVLLFTHEHIKLPHTRVIKVDNGSITHDSHSHKQ